MKLFYMHLFIMEDMVQKIMQANLYAQGIVFKEFVNNY